MSFLKPQNDYLTNKIDLNYFFNCFKGLAVILQEDDKSYWKLTCKREIRKLLNQRNYLTTKTPKKCFIFPKPRFSPPLVPLLCTFLKFQNKMVHCILQKPKILRIWTKFLQYVSNTPFENWYRNPTSRDRQDF